MLAGLLSVRANGNAQNEIGAIVGRRDFSEVRCVASAEGKLSSEVSLPSVEQL